MASEWKHARSPRCRPTIGSLVLLLYSVGQSNSQNQPRFKRRQKGISFWIQGAAKPHGKGVDTGQSEVLYLCFVTYGSIISPQGLSYCLIVGSPVSPPGLSGSLSKETSSPSSRFPNSSSYLKKTPTSCNFIMQNVYFSLLTMFSFPIMFSPKIVLSVLMKVYQWFSTWALESPAKL